VLGGDFPRRSILCRLDASCERPWERAPDTFRHPDLPQYVLEHRGRILHALLTLVRAWVAAERPGPAARTLALGSFSRWRHIVGGVLAVAGVEGFLSNQHILVGERDDEREEWIGFLMALRF